MTDHSTYLRELTTGSEWDKPSKGTCEKLTAAAAHIDALEARIKAMTNGLKPYEKAAQELLSAVDAFMGGAPLTDDKREMEKAVTIAGAFAAAAYDAYTPKGGGEFHALTRAFLLALIDPTHQDLDYLRSDPASGKVARLSAALLNDITTSEPIVDKS